MNDIPKVTQAELDEAYRVLERVEALADKWRDDDLFVQRPQLDELERALQGDDEE